MAAILTILREKSGKNEHRLAELLLLNENEEEEQQHYSSVNHNSILKKKLNELLIFFKYSKNISERFVCAEDYDCSSGE